MYRNQRNDRKDMKNKFRKYIDSIPYGKVPKFRLEIIEKCVITPEIWTNWMSGRTAISVRHQKIIEKVADVKIFDETK